MREEFFKDIPRLASTWYRYLNETDFRSDKLACMSDNRIVGDLEAGEYFMIILRRAHR